MGMVEEITLRCMRVLWLLLSVLVIICIKNINKRDEIK